MLSERAGKYVKCLFLFFFFFSRKVNMLVILFLQFIFTFRFDWGAKVQEKADQIQTFLLGKEEVREAHLLKPSKSLPKSTVSETPITFPLLLLRTHSLSRKAPIRHQSKETIMYANPIG